MNSAFFLVLRRMRAPIIVLIVIYAIAIFGLTLVPGVDARLQIIAFGEQCFVLGCQVVNNLVGTGPELLGDDAGPRNGFVVDEVEQDFGDLQATDLNVFSHLLPHSAELMRCFRFSLCSAWVGILHDDLRL